VEGERAPLERKLYHPIGVLWLVENDETYEKAALPVLKEAGLAFEELSGAETARRYPQINCEQVRWAIFEHDAGYLTARRSCAAVLEGFLAEGGEYRQLAAEAGPQPTGGELRGIKLSDGTALVADAFVSPAARGSAPVSRRHRRPGAPPPARRSFSSARPRVTSGLPRRRCRCGRITGGFHLRHSGNEWRGFKVADDTRGPVFDPTTGERVPTPEGLKAAREYLAFRFPGLKAAPLVEARVCQYENSPDEHFIIDRHPAAGERLAGGRWVGAMASSTGPPSASWSRTWCSVEGGASEFRLSRFDPGAGPRVSRSACA